MKKITAILAENYRRLMGDELRAFSRRFFKRMSERGLVKKAQFTGEFLPQTAIDMPPEC
jgi:hypothetical protein